MVERDEQAWEMSTIATPDTMRDRFFYAKRVLRGETMETTLCGVESDVRAARDRVF